MRTEMQNIAEAVGKSLKLIGQLLGAMSEGRPITLMPSKQEFSTVEAAAPVASKTDNWMSLCLS